MNDNANDNDSAKALDTGGAESLTVEDRLDLIENVLFSIDSGEFSEDDSLTRSVNRL